MRRIVRGISRVLKGEGPEQDLSMQTLIRDGIGESRVQEEGLDGNQGIE
jgi:hypothetical protein